MRHVGGLLLCAMVALAGAGAQAGGVDPAIDARLAPYTFAKTRHLVDLVERAARLIETEGDAAFARFKMPGSEWFEGPSSYFFAYALDGTCVFHAFSPELVGRNLLDLNDLEGKPVVRSVIDVAREPAKDAAGWVFYMWQDGQQLSPSWKSTYVRKVTTPDGKVYALGNGMYNANMERDFVRERVDLAAELVRTKGPEAAFGVLKDPASAFTFLGTTVFVLDDSGRTIVDPAFPTLAGRDMRDFRDAVGDKPILRLQQKLAGADDAWIQYMWPRPGEAVPTRRILYARKVVAGGRTLIVGAEYFQATPIWMRG